MSDHQKKPYYILQFRPKGHKTFRVVFQRREEQVTELLSAIEKTEGGKAEYMYWEIEPASGKWTEKASHKMTSPF